MIAPHGRTCCAGCRAEVAALRRKLDELAGVPVEQLEAAVEIALADARRELAWKGGQVRNEDGFRRSVRRRLADDPAEVRRLLVAHRPEVLARAVGATSRP